LGGYLAGGVSAYRSSRDPDHDSGTDRKTHHWDKSPHTHVWCTYHKGPNNRDNHPPAQATASQTPHSSQNYSIRTFRSHLNLSLVARLEQETSRVKMVDVGSTHRRHSAQDTGTRPGLRRCLGGGSLPEGELEPCTALSGRIERTAEGRKGKGKGIWRRFTRFIEGGTYFTAQKK